MTPPPSSFPSSRKIRIVLVGAAVLTVLAIFLADRSASTWSHDALHRPRLLEWLTHVVDPTVPGATIGLLLAGLAVAFGWRPGENAKTFLACCFGMLVAAALKDQLKLAFGRTWPETWVNQNPSWITHGVFGFHPFHGGTGWTSFPSGHMTRISVVATVIWQRLPAWRWLAVTLPLLVAVGLFGSDYHFVSDLIAGLFLGIGCAQGVMAFAGLKPRDRAL